MSGVFGFGGGLRIERQRVIWLAGPPQRIREIPAQCPAFPARRNLLSDGLQFGNHAAQQRRVARAGHKPTGKTAQFIERLRAGEVSQAAPSRLVRRVLRFSLKLVKQRGIAFAVGDPDLRLRPAIPFRLMRPHPRRHPFPHQFMKRKRLVRLRR